MERLRSFSIQEQQRSREFHSEFDPAPIRRLREEYEKQDESLEDATESTLQGATLLGFKSTLEQEDIVDRGDARERGQGRFGLEERLYVRTDRIVGELQFFLQRAARLSPARERYFHVDPEDAIIPLLEGSSDIPQLRAAWEILRSRIVLGMRFFNKYEAEVYDDAAGRTPPRSPASTAVEVEEGLRALETSDQKLRHMVAYYPHHHNPTLRHDQRLRILSRDWGSLLSQSQEYAEEQPPSPAKSFTHHLEEEALREKEVPHDTSAIKAVSYSLEDERHEVRQGKLRMAPEPSAEDTTFVTAEGAASEGKTSLFGTGPLPSMEGAETSLKTYPSPWKAPGVLRDPAYSAAIMGPNTPYKSASSFFANLSKQSGLSATVKEPLKADPNILYRLGAGPASSAYRGAQNVPTSLPDTEEIMMRRPLNRRALEARERKVGILLLLLYLRKEGLLARHEDLETRHREEDLRTSLLPAAAASQEAAAAALQGAAVAVPQGAAAAVPQGAGAAAALQEAVLDPRDLHTQVPPVHKVPQEILDPRVLQVRLVGEELQFQIPTLPSHHLPTWDGNHDTAIQYFWDVSQKAALQGYIPAALGYWLGMRLEQGSPVQIWYSSLPGDQQQLMRQHYLLYLQTIKEYYLGRTWQRRMNRVYEGQRFRQKGHEHETPQAYLGRRIMYTRMLVTTDDGGRGEVYHVLEKAPVSWGPILVVENIPSTMILYAKVVEHEQALINAAQSENSRIVTSDSLAAALKALGYTPERSRYTPKQAHLNTRDETPDVGRMSDEEPGTEEDETNDDLVLKQVYATLKDRRRPPPPGGYPFPKNDSVVTKLARLPPGPCRLCGSEKHWNRECPNYMLYNEGTKRNAKIATTEPTKEELMYQNAFSVLLNQALSSASVDFGKIDGSGFELASPLAEAGEYKTARPNGSHKLSFSETGHLEHVPRIINNRHGNSQQDIFANSRFNLPQRTRRPAVTMEEIEDEDELAHARKPKSNSSLLESVDEEEEEPDTVLESPSTRWQSRDRARQAATFSRMAEEFWINDGRLFPEDNEMEEVEPEGVESDDEWEEESRQYSEAREAHTTRRESPQRKVEFDID
ncbi:hypothetical protein B0H11DRAFT_2266488 [Mycena galericulata]|nr:hypothetical protein B0H11DRAFT_2266488 [Mycena galericulata]